MHGSIKVLCWTVSTIQPDRDALLRGQTAFFLCVWVGKKGSGNPSVEILCDRIARNWRVLMKR